MGILLANNATSTITTVVSASATTIRIDPADASKFPAIALVGDYFMAVIQDDSGVDPVIEIVKVTARSGALMTVQRAQEGTVGQSFPAGASFSLRLTAATMAALIAASIVQMQQYPGVLRVITNLSDLEDAFGIPYEEGQYGIYTGTNTMYRFVGGAWTVALQFPQIQGYIANTQMTPGMITNLLLAADAVDTSNIVANAVTTEKLAEDAVTGTAIADGAITTIKLALEAVTQAKIALAAVQSVNIDVPEFVDNVLKTEIGYVGATQITSDAVTSPKIAANSIVSTQLVAADIVANFLAVQTGYVNTLQVVNEAITTALIKTGAITTALIQTAAITTALIADAAVTTAKIGDAQIDTAKISDAAITTAKIGDLQVDGYKVVGSTVTAEFHVYQDNPTGDIVLGVTCPDWGDGRTWIYANAIVTGGDNDWDGHQGSGALGNYVSMHVFRDGTEIYQRNFTGTLGLYVPDTPGAGAHTYTLRLSITNPGSNPMYLSFGEMFALVLSK